MQTNPGRFASTADAYDHHVGRYGAQLAAGLIDAADIRPGHRVLDVGCGPGPLTRALADRVGARNVAAVDPSPDFVEACLARVPGADVRVGVAEELPFSSQTFDAALAQLVVQLMDDRGAGVAEMIRVTRPAGAVAACVWDSTTMPVLRAFWDAALAVAPERAGVIDDGRRVGYERPDELGELWQARGLVAVSTGELWVRADYESFDDLFQPFAAGTGHSGACYASLDRAGQERLLPTSARRTRASAAARRQAPRARRRCRHARREATGRAGEFVPSARRPCRRLAPAASLPVSSPP